MKNFKEKFNNIIIDKLSVDKNQLKPETTFTDLGADSLDVVELIMEFETIFNIEIPDEDGENILTVGDAEKYIKEKLTDEH